MISLMFKIKKLAAKSLGCGDCTMLEPWCVATSQRPQKCKLSELYVYCPVTGKMPSDWKKIDQETTYLFVDDEEQ